MVELPPQLIDILLQASPIAIAFSGGIDSRFLCHSASLLQQEGVEFLLVHVTGPHVPAKESEEALLWAKRKNLDCRVVSFDPLMIDAVRQTAEDRCYHCKKAMFSLLRQEIARLSALRPDARAYTLCDGSNASDLEKYRPGLQALQELAIRSPLAESGITKPQLRALALQTGLDAPQQAARPCLLTRFAYGITVSKAALSALESAESAVSMHLTNMFGETLPDFRLRLVNGPTASFDHVPEQSQRQEHSFASTPKTISAHTPKVPSDNVPEPLASSYTAELHIDLPTLAPENASLLLAAIEQYDFPSPRLALMEGVSGHYDRKTL